MKVNHMRAGTVYGDLEEMKKDMTPLIQYAIEPKIRGTEIIIEKTNKDTKPLRIHADKKIILEENAIKELQALTINKTYSLDATLTEEGKIYVHDITMYDNNSVTDLNWRERKKLREQLAYKQNGDVIEIPSAEIIPQDTYTTHATRCTTHPHSTGCIIKNMAATYSSGTTAHYSAYDLGISGEGSGMTNPLPSPLNPGNDKVSGMPINSNPIPTPLSETKEKKMEIVRMLPEKVEKEIRELAKEAKELREEDIRIIAQMTTDTTQIYWRGEIAKAAGTSKETVFQYQKKLRLI